MKIGGYKRVCAACGFYAGKAVVEKPAASE